MDQLVYFESLKDMESARKREKQVKSYSRVKKQALVESINPSWDDLAPQLS